MCYFVLSALVLLLSACQSTQHSSVFQLVDATSSPISATDIDFSWLEGIESIDIDNFRQIVLLSNSDNTAYLHIKPQLENNRQNIHLYVRMVDSQNHYEEYIYPIPENQRAEFVSWSPNAKYFAAQFGDTDVELFGNSLGRAVHTFSGHRALQPVAKRVMGLGDAQHGTGIGPASFVLDLYPIVLAQIVAAYTFPRVFARLRSCVPLWHGVQ